MTGAGNKTLFPQEPKQFDFFARKRLKPILPIFDEKDIKRFWSKIDIRSKAECWLWRGQYKSNHKLITVNGQGILAHRTAYALHYGFDPIDFYVCHTCDSPCCCNPYHLWLGNMQANAGDKVAKGRAHGRNPLSAMPERGFTFENSENYVR